MTDPAGVYEHPQPGTIMGFPAAGGPARFATQTELGISASAASILTSLIGSATLATGSMMYGQGTATLLTLAIGAANTVMTSSGTAPQWSTSLAPTGTVASKQAAAAGISLDHNSATGNFTARLSPANLTANRRVLFPDADLTFTSGGTLDLATFTLTVAATGTAATGSGSANQVATWSGTNALTGSSAWTATTTNGALLEAYAAGTSTATATTAIRTTTATSTGTLAASATITGNSITLTPNSGGTNGASSVYIGESVNLSTTSSASNRYGTSTLSGLVVNTTFSMATTGSTVLAGMNGLQVNPSIVMTGGSGTSTITNIYGLSVIPGTFSSASGGTTTLSVYCGLYLGALTTSGAGTTNIGTRYGIFQDDTSAVSLFRGNVGVGNSAPVAGSSLVLGGGTTSVSPLRWPVASAPSSPAEGDSWFTSSGFFAKFNGTSQQFPVLALSNVFSAAQTIGVSGSTAVLNLVTSSNSIAKVTFTTSSTLRGEFQGDNVGLRIVTNATTMLEANAAGTVVNIPVSAVIGTTSLLGSERLRINGGSIASPGTTDVAVGGGKLVTGDTSSTSFESKGGITHNSATLLFINTNLGNGAAAQVGTLTNAPTAGNPTKWVPINDNGTTRYIPAW